MAAGGRTRTRRHLDIWAGYVDVLSTLLMVIIFTLMVFVIGQLFLSQALSGRERKLVELSQQLASLGDMLSMEKTANTDLRNTITQLTQELQQATTARDQLKQQLASTLSDREALAAALAEAKAAAAAAAAAATAAKTQVDAKLVDAYKTIDADQQKLQTLLGDIAVLESLRDELRQKLEASQAASDEAQQKLATNQGSVADLQAKLSTAEQQIAVLSQQLTAGQTVTAGLRQQLADSQNATSALQQQLATSQAETEEQRRLRSEAELQIEMLNRQVLAMRQQLAKLIVALDASEAKAKADEVQVIDLGKRLNEALASKVEELARYRSEFFGKLREVLGNRPDIQIVGDRFIFQSEVLFGTGSADIGEEGKHQLAAFADTLKNIAARIPPDIDWILRVDGHTDKRPYSGLYGGNWELSTARAIAVVQFLIEQGIPPNRLVAAGFAEFRPLIDADNEDAYRHNRRIELKLDQR